MKQSSLNSQRTDWEGIAIPIILMVTGIVLLAGNYLGFLSLERIQNLWPAAVIVIGILELLPWCEAAGDRSPSPAGTRNDSSRDVPQPR